MTKNNFKKKDIIKTISDKTGLSNNFSKTVVDEIIQIMTILVRKKNLNLKNIGSFSKVFKKERMGRNPKTKETFPISSRFSIRFTPSKKLLTIINNTL